MVEDPRFLEGTLYTSTVQSQLSFGAPRKAPPPLPRGVVLLDPTFLSAGDVDALIAAVDSVTAIQPFHIPAVRNPITGGPAFSNLYMAFAGSEWDGVSKEYTAGSCSIPPVVLRLARRAIESVREKHPGDFPHLPSDADWASPDTAFTCLFNYYPPTWGEIFAHSDTSEPSLREGKKYPVVSFSIGDAVDFNLGEGATKTSVRLHSGDVLLFGGDSRTIRHGIDKSAARGPRPAKLRMASGRLNITLRRL